VTESNYPEGKGGGEDNARVSGEAEGRGLHRGNAEGGRKIRSGESGKRKKTERTILICRKSRHEGHWRVTRALKKGGRWKRETGHHLLKNI